ncbi:MAG: zinc ribbon domain-containing protein [Candidatus Bathyarchaeia archaeon]|jgi:TM2 domain-containing membrane protein YozV
MKAWTAIGAIFSLIGFVVLIVGVARIVQVESLYNQLGASQYLGSLENTVIWSASESYIVGSIICFIIGGVGFAAGSSANSNKPVSPAAPHPVNYWQPQPPPPPQQVGAVKYCSACGSPNPKENQFCGRCGKRFIEQSTEQNTFKLT